MIEGLSSDLIKNELAKADELKNNVPSEIGMLVLRSANRTIEEASLRPDPKPLWKSLWYEGEVCCLFSDSNLGKSILATQIANEIAKTQKVLLFDFELSDKQFQLRYTGADGVLFKFSEQLYRVEINKEALDHSTDFEEAVVQNVEEAALVTGAKVLIVDNLTYLCSAAEKGDAASSLMMNLTGLKKKYDLSILVLAHTPKRSLSNPITQNDLAGSKKLYNFFDSAFAIGRSFKDNGLRYIKQVKCRYGSYDYDENNVIICEIVKDGSFLHFSQIGFATESEHLRTFSDDDRAEMIETVKRLHKEGRTQRQIKAETGLALATVNKYINK